MTDWTHAEVPGDPTAVGTAPSGYLRAADPKDLMRRRTLALWGTGAFAGMTVVTSLTTATVDFSRGGSALVAVALLLALMRVAAGVAGWITLARWMSGARAAYVAAGVPAPAAWQVWAGWFVPVYGLWGPFAAMRQLTSHLPAIEAARHRWWIGFVFSWVFLIQAAFQSSVGWNHALVVLAAAFLVFSFAMLRTVIDRTTESLVRA